MSAPSRHARCPVCGADFVSRRRWKNGQRVWTTACAGTCSITLAWRTKRFEERLPYVVRTCATCGLPFEVPRKTISQERVNGPSRRQRARYCSPKCSGIRKRRYSDQTHRQREKKRRYRARLALRSAARSAAP